MKQIRSHPYMCFDALLAMIVKDVFPQSHFSQDYFAEQFGVTIPYGEHTKIKNVRFSNNIEEYGTSVNTNDINVFFDKNKIPLSISFIPANYIDEATFDVFLIENCQNAYVVFAFCYGILYNEPLNANIGHVSLLNGFVSTTYSLEIYDPGPRNPGMKVVKIDNMFYAMKRRGGVYLLKKLSFHNHNTCFKKSESGRTK